MYHLYHKGFDMKTFFHFATITIFLAFLLSACGEEPKSFTDNEQPTLVQAIQSMTTSNKPVALSKNQISAIISHANDADDNIETLRKFITIEQNRLLSLGNNIEWKPSKKAVKTDISVSQTYQQYFNGIRVKNGMMKISYYHPGQTVTISQRLFPLKHISQGNLDLFSAGKILENTIGHTMLSRMKANLTSYAQQIILPDSQNTSQGIIAWKIYWASDYPLDRIYYYIDTRDGKIIKKENQTQWANAQVFLPSPITNADLSETTTVTLSHLDTSTISNPQGFLQGELIHSYNCLQYMPNGKNATVTVDIPPEIKQYIKAYLPGFNEDTVTLPICYETQYANSREDKKNGNYFYFPNEIDDPATEKIHENWGDKFAEVHAYYHLNFAYEAFREISKNPNYTIHQVPLRATVNFLIPWINNSFGGALFELVPIDNAAFVPALEPGFLDLLDLERDFDSIIIGQGSNTDFAYDGTILYHEFTHAIVRNEVNLSEFSFDDYGFSSGSVAVNEGTADYFAAVISGKETIAEYVGKRIPSTFQRGNNKVYRSVNNNHKCPDHIQGEEHFDGHIWSGSLWELRTWYLGQFGADKSDEFDSAVFSILSNNILEQATFEEAAVQAISGFETLFGKETSEKADYIFKSRGLIGCERIVEIENPLQDQTFIRGKSSDDDFEFIPSPLQYVLHVPQHATHLKLKMILSASQGLPSGTEDILAQFDNALPELGLLVKSKERIFFSYNDNKISSDASHQQDFDFLKEFPNEGNVSIHLENSCGGQYYLAPINKSKKSHIIQGYEIEYAKTDELDPACPEQFRDGGDIIEDDTDSDNYHLDDTDNVSAKTSTKKEKGCGCSSTPSKNSSAILGCIFFGIWMILLRNRKLNSTNMG